MSKHYLSSSSKVVSLRSRLPKRRPSAGSKPPTLPVDPLWAEDTIAAMARCITSAPGEMEAQREQLALVQGLTRARTCYLLQKTDLSNQLEVVAVRGRNDPRIAAVAPGEGVAGKAFSDGRIVRADGTVAVMVRRNRDLQTAVAGLKSLEKNREVLISNISHDLKNPLSTLKVYLNLLGRKNLGELTEKQAKAVSTCERSADRLLRMINDLLLLSRLQSGKMQLNERPFGLKDLAQNVVNTLSAPATVAKVQLVLLPCPEVYVRGDRDRLFEAFGNLAESAVQRSRGTVQIRVSAQKSGLAIFSVHDNGHPIPPDELEHAFELYQRDRIPKRPRQYTRNLGLPVAAKVVQLHGGKIEIKSSSESGTTMEVSLPAFAAAVALVSAPVAPRAGSILLVEDDVDCREVLQQVLDQEGYRVASVADTGAAISILQKSRPAMVLLDLRLSREDGRSVLHYIRESASAFGCPGLHHLRHERGQLDRIWGGPGADRRILREADQSAQTAGHGLRSGPSSW